MSITCDLVTHSTTTHILCMHIQFEPSNFPIPRYLVDRCHIHYNLALGGIFDLSWSKLSTQKEEPKNESSLD